MARKILFWIFLLFPFQAFANAQLTEINALHSFPMKANPSSMTRTKLADKNMRWLPLTKIDKSKLNNTIILAGTTLNKPLVVISRNNGTSWEVKNTDNLPKDFDFSGLSCAGKGKGITCISPIGTNSVVISNDAGETWTTKQINSKFTYGDNKFTRCTGKGKGLICIAGPLVLDKHYYMATSADAGKTWQMTEPNNYPDNSQTRFNTADCAGSGKKAICVLGGANIYDCNGNNHCRFSPLAVFTKNGGKTWDTSSPQDEYNPYSEVSASGCSSDTKSASCLLGGWGNGEERYALTMNSLDNFSSVSKFSLQSPELIEPTIDIISCSNSNDPLCFLGGQDISFFGDKTPRSPRLCSGCSYDDAACSGSITNGFCVVKPSGYVHLHIAEIWRIAGGIESYEVEEEIKRIECAGKDSRAFCALLLDGNTVLLSFDDAKTWISKQVPVPITVHSFVLMAD